jgi:integrin beta 8
MAVIKIVPMPGAVGDKGDEGAPGAQGPQGPAGQNGLPGTPALWSYQGAYNSASAYAVGDVVVYQGQLYYTKSVTTAGTLPTDTAKFDLIASKGADGQPGANGANGINGTNGTNGADFGIYYLGNYNPSSGYVPNIAVVRGSDGQLYLAKASGQLGDPVGNTAQWEVWIPKGADGTNGTNGTNGADALWNYTGEYNGGASYAVGDIATYDGQLWYRVGANGGNVGDTPSPGFWNLLAAKGEPGTDVFAEDGTLYGPTNFGALKVLGLINSGDNDLALEANDADIYLQASSGAVTIAAPEVTITSNAVPSSVNINTYNGATISSARTSGYSDADKVVATLGDLPTGATGTFETPDSKLVTVTNGIITSIESLT